MDNLKKRLIFRFLTVVLATALLFSGCTKNQNPNSGSHNSSTDSQSLGSSSNEGVSDNDFVSYCAKEETAKGQAIARRHTRA